MTQLPTMRRGYVLPFVIVAVAAAGVLSMTFVTSAYRAARAGALAVRADQAHAAADEALATALDRWSADSLWLDAPGTTITRSMMTNSGVPVRIEWVRSTPLVAWLQVRSRVGSARVHDSAHQGLVRVIRLEPPAAPVPAVVATSGPLFAADGTLLSGSDLAVPDSPCGTTRDTVSVPAATAYELRPEMGASWNAPPFWTPVTASAGTQLEHGIRALGARVHARPRDSLAGPLPEAQAGGDSPRWRALSLSGSVLNVRSPVPWRGLLVLHGPVALVGELTMHGLLVVDGPLDARAATLRVRGAVIIADPSRQGTHLGADSQLLYDRCAVQMALATVSRPATNPFSLWQRLSD